MALAASTGLATAQEPAPAGPRVVTNGDRVRIVAPGLFPGAMEGRVEALYPDTLVLRPGEGEPFAIPLAGVKELAVNRGSAQQLFVFLAVFPAAYLGGALAKETFFPGDGTVSVLEGTVVALGGVVGLLAGRLVGAQIDRLVFGEKWEEVPVSRVRWETRTFRDTARAGEMKILFYVSVAHR
jgi:hypothetical protein